MKAFASKFRTIKSSFEIRIPKGSLAIRVSPDNSMTATSRRFLLNHFGFDFQQLSKENTESQISKNVWVYRIDPSDRPLFSEIQTEDLKTIGESDSTKSSLLLAKKGEDWAFLLADDSALDLKEWDSVWLIGEVTNTYGQGLLSKGDEPAIRVLSANSHLAKLFYSFLGVVFVLTAINVGIVFVPGPYELPAIVNEPILKRYQAQNKL